MTASTLVRPTLVSRSRSSAVASAVASAIVGAPTWTMSLALGGFGTLVSLIAIGTPSFWGDEAASVLSAQRSLPSLFRMLGTVDAVHGSYYLFLHFWIRLFGTSEFAVRLPSAIAIGFVVAGVFLIGRQLSTRRVAIIAALICSVLPRIESIGGQARSYAISTAIAVWLTILLVRFVERQTTSRLAWFGYAAGLAVGVYAFLYLGLLVAVHGAYLILRRQSSRVRRRWLQSVAAAVILTGPLLYSGYAERTQIAFLAHRNYAKFTLIMTNQWFGTPLFATAAWIAIALAVAGIVLTMRRRAIVDRVAPLAIVWFVLPTAVLLMVNLVTPSYNLRYLSMSAPAAALLIALGIVSLRRRWLIAAATVAVMALALPADIQERSPYAMDGGSDWRQASAYVAAHSEPGDAVLFDETVRPSRLPRLAMRMYPGDYAGLTDVELVKPYDQTSGLWDVQAPLDTVAPKLATTKRVLLLEIRGSHDHGTRVDVTTLENLGFTLQHTETIHRTVVYILTRGTA